jgi:hypothetical protein
MRRRRLLIAAGLVLALIALWTAIWHLVADKIQARLGAWIEARRAEGLVAEHAGARVSGFPAAWVLIVAEPSLAGAGAAAWTWQGEALEARFSPGTLRDIAVRFSGVHTVSAGGGAELGGAWTVRAARPDGRIVLHADGRLDRLELDLGDAELRRLPDAAPLRLRRLAGQVVVAHPAAAADHRTETFTLSLALDGLAPVTPPVAALGSSIQSVRADLSFKGRLPPGKLATAVAAWRDDGGTIEVRHAGLRWGPVNADASGTLALDRQNRPLGAFTARWRGYAETIDALQVSGRLRPWEAAGAKIMLGALARQQPDGVSQIEVPLTAQDGRLFVAGFPLLRLPPLPLD